jgi:hypothetical protein
MNPRLALQDLKMLDPQRFGPSLAKARWIRMPHGQGPLFGSEV